MSETKIIPSTVDPETSQAPSRPKFNRKSPSVKKARGGPPRKEAGHFAKHSTPAAAVAKHDPRRSPIKYNDEFEIENKDPDREYHWVSKKILDQAGGFDRRGWEPLTAANSKGEVMVSIFGNHNPGTDMRNGDLVACFMPKERMAMKRARQERRRAMFDESVNRLRNNFKKSSDSEDRFVNKFELTIQRPGRVDNYAEGGVNG